MGGVCNMKTASSPRPSPPVEERAKDGSMRYMRVAAGAEWAKECARFDLESFHRRDFLGGEGELAA